jgi:hypothetical protein
MARDSRYFDVVVESFRPKERSGLHGELHVRPVAGQRFGSHLFVECSKVLSDPKKYPVGTKFKIRAKLTDREGGGEFLYSFYGWKPQVLTNKEAAALIKRLYRK